LGAGPADHLIGLEPESDLLLCAVDAVAAVADVAADIDSVIEADSAWGRGERVGSTEDEAAGLDNLAALPDHGGNGAGCHVYSPAQLVPIWSPSCRAIWREGGRRTADETGEERLVLQILIMLLEVGLSGGDELEGDKLVAALLKAGDDVADKATLVRSASQQGKKKGKNELVRLFGSLLVEVFLTWTPSGLIAMKLLGCEILLLTTFRSRIKMADLRLLGSHLGDCRIK
jgi:hypothetical protein